MHVFCDTFDIVSKDVGSSKECSRLNATHECTIYIIYLNLHNRIYFFNRFTHMGIYELLIFECSLNASPSVPPIIQFANKASFQHQCLGRRERSVCAANTVG